MIFFAEINKNREDHLQINIAMLNVILCGIDFNTDINLFGSKKHLNLLTKNRFHLHKLIYNFLPVIDGGLMVWPFKYLLESYALLKIFIAAKKKQPDFIFFSSLFPFTHFTYLLLKPFFKNVKVLIALHGELNYINSDIEFKYKLLGYFLKKNISNKRNNNTYYLVYSDHIKNKILNDYKVNEKKIYCLDHPYVYTNNSYNTLVSSPLLIGSIGIASVSKNTHLIFDLANQSKLLIKEKKIEFKILGKSMIDILPFKNNLVNYNYSNVMLSKQQYQIEIANLHYVIFFYGDNTYSLSPSGVFFDAIEFEKPIIVLQNQLFDFYFKRFGNIGYSCRNFEELKNTVEIIANKPPTEEYQLQIDNIKKIKNSLSIKNLGEIFWNTIGLKFKA
jgi:hypothetical protein